jgi:vacuolar-type H+-ATPase subunit E/Vma4
MAIENLLQQIRQDTDRRISEIIAAAYQQAEEIISRAEKKIQQDRERELARIDRKVREYEESLISPARLRARQMILLIKQRLLDEVFAELRSAWDNQSAEFKCKMYARWLKNYDGGELEISAAEAALKNIWSESFLKEINSGGKKFKIVTIAQDFRFGFRLKKSGWEADFTDETLLDNFRAGAQIRLNQEWLNG